MLASVMLVLMVKLFDIGAAYVDAAHIEMSLLNYK
jgi:hypothetical protein